MNEDKEIGRFVTTFGKRPQLESKELYFWLNKGKGWLARAELDRTEEARRIIAHFVGFVGLTFKAQRPELMAKAEAFLAEQEES